jgi:hypothetical protein
MKIHDAVYMVNFRPIVSKSFGAMIAPLQRQRKKKEKGMDTDVVRNGLDFRIIRFRH